MRKVVSVEARPEYTLFLIFDDGTQGEISIADRLFGSMFEPLKNAGFFEQVKVDSYGAVCWPNDADLDPDALYQKLSIVNRKKLMSK
jgi:hypothetical protein